MSDEKKEYDCIGTGTWKIKTSELSVMINSYNSNSYHGSTKRLVSSLISNSKTRVFARITLTARPTNNGQISLNFQMHSSHSNSSCTFEIKCNQPYFAKANNYSSVSHTVDKTSLLSPSVISITYSMKTSKVSRCFSCEKSKNYNGQILLPNVKPIPFEFTVTSSLLEDVATKRDRVCLLTSIHDPITNTVWGIYLVFSGGYSIQMQPSHSKANSIKAWIDIEAKSIMFYQSNERYNFNTDYRGYRGYLSPQTIADLHYTNLRNEKKVHFTGHIFGTQWGQKDKDITGDLFSSGARFDAVNDDQKEVKNDVLLKKLSEMSLQIQTLSTGLNNVLKVNRELKNENAKLMNENSKLISKVNTMENALNKTQNELKNMLNGMTNTLSNKLSSLETKLGAIGTRNDDNKDNAENVVFDPIYATFYYWLNNQVCLPQYLSNFKKSGYDSMDAVVDLNENELQELGITTKGHRVRLLKGIKKYTESKIAKEGTNYI